MQFIFAIFVIEWLFRLLYIFAALWQCGPDAPASCYV